MFRRAKTQPSPPTASWRRELLLPAIHSLISLAFLGAFIVDGSPLLKMALLGAVFLPDLFPRFMTSGNKLIRPSENQQPGTTLVTRTSLQRVANGNYGRMSAHDNEENAPLPEIIDAPPLVQKLIHNLGYPILSSKTSRKIHITTTVLMYYMSAGAFVLFFYLGQEKNLNKQSTLIVLGTFAAIIILTTYRVTFRRLYDIYTADAAKTGRQAFPALSR